MRRFGIVIETEKQYRDHFNKEYQELLGTIRILDTEIIKDRKEDWKIKGLVDDLTAENAGLKEEIFSDRKAKNEMLDKLRKFWDLKLSERIGHLIESLEERNTAVGAANLDIVVTGPMTTYRVIEDLRKLRDDVHLTGATGRRVKKGRKSAVQ